MSRKLFLPTKRRLTKARNDGDIAKSRELSGACALLGAAACTAIFLEIYSQVSPKLAETFAHLADFHTNRMLLSGVVWSKLLWQLILPPLGGACAGGLIAELLQTGVLFRPVLVAPKLHRCSPRTGIRRMLGLQETDAGTVVPLGMATFGVKTAVALVCIPVCTWIWLGTQLTNLPRAEVDYVPQIVELLAVLSLQLGSVCLGFAFIVGCVDLLYQRASRMSRLRMTAEEYKRELRENEGDPELQQQRKQLHREVLLHETVQAVRRAKVLVINKWS